MRCVDVFLVDENNKSKGTAFVPQGLLFVDPLRTLEAGVL